jgi:hypothetical protein
MDKHTSSEETAKPAEQETQHAPKPETVDQTKAAIAPEQTQQDLKTVHQDLVSEAGPAEDKPEHANHPDHKKKKH